MHFAQGFLIALILFSDLKVEDVSVKDNGCQCVYEKYDCGCCAHMEVEKIGLNDTGQRR